MTLSISSHDAGARLDTRWTQLPTRDGFRVTDRAGRLQSPRARLRISGAVWQVIEMRPQPCLVSGHRGHVSRALPTLGGPAAGRVVPGSPWRLYFYTCIIIGHGP